MTLTRLLPSLRSSIPDPLNADLWPEYTSATTTDVVVAGVSLLRLVDICQSPCIHTAAAVVPGTHGRPSTLERATAIVTTITEIAVTATGTLCISVDARFDTVRPLLSELRLIGRASVAHTTSAALVLADSNRDAPAVLEVLTGGLPADIRVGDLLAVPCRGELALRHISRSHAVPEQNTELATAAV
ncbi:hypothetical protein [Subtercola endophyticus]|uniref:hypothetical protein n=1 Tax=Subtercola endophyticus TaxID=2895559 RepID=UPI001E3E6620|nr:hypothetical protein [Subtercola endophyticus]UFS59113.1 hypothetical protein LQ955_19415 [Subtercola endophyticus]